MNIADEFTKSDLEVMSRASNYNGWILRTLVEPHLGARVLEIGAGIGNFTQEILANPHVNHLTCVELDASCLEACRERLGAGQAGKTVNLIHGDYLKVALPLSSFDTVILLNVLEHLPDDAVAIQKAYDLLKPGGQLILYVPAFPAIAGAIDERLGHFHRYTKSSVAALVGGVGFEIRRMRYYNLAGFFGWLWRFRILQQNHQDPNVVTFFDRVIFPIQMRFEALAPWQPFGQSLFGLLQRPATRRP